MAMVRSAQVYADFLLPFLTAQVHLVDVGCGSGELTLELAGFVGRVTGVDIDEVEIADARRRASRLEVTNADFHVGDAYSLRLPSDHVDAVFAHSTLEALDRPQDAVAEMKRVLKPGGMVAVASVEYAGLILAGPHPELGRRFYEIRERLWQLDGADPYRGRELRGLLLGAGFVDVVATTKCISYGKPDTVKEFGLGRAEDCTDDWFVTSAEDHGLASTEELAEMQRAWLDWSDSPTSYAAFAWCRAVGRKPSP
ncbi:methyltransferase domain-containing protein [soil metagenome]